MANEKNNIYELVSDDDQTAELEALTFRQDDSTRNYVPAESDEDTSDFSRHRNRDSQTIGKLQYDIEQLRAKWLGLETEIAVREEVTDKLHVDIRNLRESVSRKEKLAKKRDRKVKALKVEIRERDERHELLSTKLTEDLETARKALREAPEPTVLSRVQESLADSENRLARSEAYADSLRRKLQDLISAEQSMRDDYDRMSEEAAEIVEKNRSFEQALADAADEKIQLEQELASTGDQLAEKNRSLEEALAVAADDKDRLEGKLTSTVDELDEKTQSFGKALAVVADEKTQLEHELVSASDQHAEELRALNLELGEARETVAESKDLSSQLARLSDEFAETAEKNRSFEKTLAVAADEKMRLEQELASTVDQHAEDCRVLRLDLGEAQEAVAQAQEQSSQLASDLSESRGFKDELERMLCDSSEQSQQQIDKLEKDLAEMTRAANESEEKLNARGDTIDVLLAELERKSAQIESINEIGDVISDIGGRISEQFDQDAGAPALLHKAQERVTRVLIGKVGKQLLRFPLFKDRLTIGRTAENDIQLDAVFISRRHAVIQIDGDTTRVIDWGSKNGVYVNSEKVTEHFLKNGDIVSIGNAHFRYDERPKRDC